jgi:hypothetical protein
LFRAFQVIQAQANVFYLKNISFGKHSLVLGTSVKIGLIIRRICSSDPHLSKVNII